MNTHLKTLSSGIKVIFTDCDFVMLAGPVFVISYKDKIGEVLKIPDDIKNIISTGESVIFVSSQLKHYLLNQELNAIIKYNEGDIILNHLNIKPVNNGCNKAYEKAKKDYVAKLYGKAILRTAIKKSLEVSKVFQYKYFR